jgi:uncharacterized protein YecE (DUF72 family)
MRLSVGTSGYSYAEWKGSFYPEKLPAREMLAHYATRLPAVEINNTFYRMPRRDVLDTWREQVPAGFRFAVKGSRRITHIKRLADVGEPLSYLLEATARLEEHLGVILFQLPPYMKKDLERLETFLAELPAGTRAALEFRHGSWHDEEVIAALSAAGVALCIADTDTGDAPPIVSTASHGYLRLRRPDYDDDALARWAERIGEQSWEEAFVFFKHEEAGAGPRMAARFLELATERR